MSATKTLAKGTAWGLIGIFILKLVGWLYYILIARLVPQEEIGVFSAALGIVSILVMFSDLGLCAGSISRYVPFFYGKRHFSSLKAVLKISLLAGTAFSLICIALVYWFSFDVAAFYHSEKIAPVLRMMAFYMLAYNLFYAVMGFLGGRKMIKYSSYTGSTQAVARLIISVALVLLVSASAESLTAGFVSSFFIAAFVGGVWAVKEYRRIPKSQEEVRPLRLLSEMVPFGLTIVMISSMYLINSQFDSILLAHLLPPEVNMKMVGVYALVVSLSSLMTVFAVSIGGIFHPVINEMWAENNTAEMRKASSNYLRWIALFTTPLLVTMLCFPKEILTVFYGESYAFGASALMIYSAGLFIFSFSYPVQNLLSGMRRLNVTIKIVFCGVLANIAINYVLIPLYGIAGAAAASFSSFTLMSILFLSIRKKTYMEVPREIYKPLLAGLAAGIVLVSLKQLTGGLGFYGLDYQSTDLAGELIRKFLKAGFLLMLAALSGVVYLMFLTALKPFRDVDRDLLSGGMRRMRLPDGFISFVCRLLFR